jgi:hypothetical protein
MDVEWLTYDEIAERLGMGRESARTLVKRKRWARQQGNDGRARIGVPVEEIASRQEQSGERSPERPEEQSPERSEERTGEVLAVLTRHIERLEAQLDEAHKRAADRDEIAIQRDAARAERDVVTAQVEALRTALAAAEQDRDRWHEAATKQSRRWWQWRRAS